MILLLILSYGFSAESKLKVGDEAPPIFLMKLESNKYFGSKEFLGKKNLVVNFFATWCVPCEKEIPELIKMSKELGDDFQFVLVDVNETPIVVKKHVDEKKIPLQVILDVHGKVFERFGSNMLPLLVVIDKKGKITYHHTGYQKGDELRLKTHLIALDESIHVYNPIVGKIAVIYLNNGKELEGEIISDKKNKYIMIKMEGREKKIKYNKIDYVRFGE